GGSDHFGFGTARGSRLADATLEFLVGQLENVKREVDVRPGIVPRLMPTLRTEFERFVVSLFVLLDQAFEADVAPDFITQMIALQQQQQARYATIAVAERVNA